MSWTYRVMRKVEGKGITHYYSFGIHEVYSSPKGWTEDPVALVGESVEELRETLKHMLAALDKPVLDCKTGKAVGRAK